MKKLMNSNFEIDTNKRNDLRIHFMVNLLSFAIDAKVFCEGTCMSFCVALVPNSESLWLNVHQ